MEKLAFKNLKSWRCRDRRRVRQAEGWIAVIQYLPRNFFRCSALPLSFAFSSSTPSQSTEPLTPLLPSSATAAAPRAVALTTVYTPRRIAQICIGNGIAACAAASARVRRRHRVLHSLRTPASLPPSVLPRWSVGFEKVLFTLFPPFSDGGPQRKRVIQTTSWIRSHIKTAAVRKMRLSPQHIVLKRLEASSPSRSSDPLLFSSLLIRALISRPRRQSVSSAGCVIAFP